MIDYQRIVDDVRSLLFAEDGDAVDFMRAAAADYSIACDEVNERLHQCGSLLRQGLRSEAIQLAEIEPNLLDLTVLLDFPERPLWDESCSRHGIALSTPLMADAAAALNEAYAQEQPLAALLQRHRLLALARGSLRERIDVLRSLTAMDSDNPVWPEDLRIFEQERQKQIQEEIKMAARNGDTAALALLDEELSNPDWKNPPSTALANSASDAETTLRYWSMQSQLEELAPELESALSHCQIELGQTLYAQWNEIIVQFGWQPHQQLAERVAPALKWVREHLEHEAAITALANVVDDEQSVARLRELHRAALKFGKISTKLEARYVSRLALLERKAQRMFCLKLGAALLGGVVVIMIIGSIVSHESHEQKVAAARKNLPFLIDRGDLERAEQLVRDLSPQVKNDPRLEKLFILLEDRRKVEEDREKNFTRRFDTALYLHGKLQEALADDPPQTALDGLRGELTLFQTELDQAKNIMRKDEERSKIAALEELNAATRDNLQQRLDREFLARYDDFQQRLKNIESDTHSNIQELETTTSEFKEDLRKWEANSRYVSVALTPRIGALGERLSSVEKNIKKLGREEHDAKSITAAIGDIPNFVNALKVFILNHPHSGHTPDLERAVAESLCWQVVEEWNKLSRQINDGGISRLGPAEAQEAADLAGVVAENFKGCPECEPVEALLPYLNAIAQRLDGGQRIDAPLRRLFAVPLVKDVWIIEKENGQRYYVEEKPNVDKPFFYIVGFDGKRKSGIIPPSEREKANVVRAPQVAVAERIQPTLDALNDENWESSFYKMISVIHSDQSMDPILKANLLQQVLEVGVRGSYCLEKTFQGHCQWFNKERLNAFANWLDPNDAVANQARTMTAKALENFPDITQSGAMAAEDLKALRQRRVPEYRWVGWLHKTRDGRCECLMRQSPNQEGALVTVFRSDNPRLVTIGRYSDKAATIDTKAPLVVGRPVFLQIP